jgi:hypothetical protein
LSRTGSPHIALKFALHGVEDVDPLGVTLGEVKEGDGVILRSIVPAANIIGTADMEFIIDPRGVEFSTEPSQIGASRASYYSMLTYVVPVDIPTRMDAVSTCPQCFGRVASVIGAKMAHWVSTFARVVEDTGSSTMANHCPLLILPSCRRGRRHNEAIDIRLLAVG